jgi:hypothetical protein
MSGLNTYFVPLTILQEQFWDKLEDAPLAGGKLYFYQDEARTIPKSVYVLTGNPPDYTYAVASPSDSSITLSSIGTVDDGMGNNLVIYGYPYDDTDFDGSGNIELYYMTVYSSDGIFQFSVGGFPNVPFEETPTSSGQEKNFIKNGQFVLNNGTLPISLTSTEVAYGGWYYTRSSNTSTDVVSFPRFGSPIAGGVPSGNPRYACNVTCSVTGADSYKVLEIKFNDVNRFSDPSQTLSLYFMAKSSAGSSITVNLYKYFGSGGSGAETTQIISTTVLTSSYEPVRVSFPFGSNVGKTIGANDDDYFSIQVSFNPALTFNVTVTDFVLYLGSELITTYPFGVNSYNDLQIYNMSVPHTTYLSALFPLAINTSWQAITGTSITVQPGVYLLSYNCSVTVAVHTGVLGHGIYTAIFNNTTGLILPNTECHPVFVTSNAPLTFGDNESAGNGAVTILLRITVPTTVQIYVKLDNITDAYAMSATNACINAMKVG